MKKFNTEDFIKKAKIVHGDKYDYSKVEYINCDTKVCIICPEHGEFWQTPYKHLKGNKCPKCAAPNKGITTEEFAEKAKLVHGDKYDYSKVEILGMHNKVCIICPEHGEFWQSPSNHLRGQKCPKCSKVFMDKDYFIEKAKIVHGDKYDYSKVEYINCDTKVCIICPEHGKFWQVPTSHLQGNGCPKCAGKQKSNTEEFIEKARAVHSDKYNYSKVEYVNNSTKVCIICPEHGEFWQSPHEHMHNNGCPKCSFKKRIEKRILPKSEYVQRANEIHNNYYDYSVIVYNNLKDKINIICPKHGIFQQEAWSHLEGCGCPKCSNSISKNEDEIFAFCKNLLSGNDVLQRNRQIIRPMELDVFVPYSKIAIEYNGLLWHSDRFQNDRDYHLKKLKLCQAKGIQLIQIFEDEYINHKDIVFSKIKHLLNKDGDLPKLYGRKCEIKEITYNISKDFLDNNHIQGGATATVYLGCYYKDILVGVMAFKKEKKESHTWELARFASDINSHCVGIGGKLFNHFIKNYNPENIKSFADRRWTINEDDNLYIQLGFKFDSYIVPDYHYYNPKYMKRFHKFGFRKQRLHKKYGFPLTMTETEMAKKLGYHKIYDCGLIKYVWHNQKTSDIL